MMDIKENECFYSNIINLNDMDRIFRRGYKQLIQFYFIIFDQFHSTKIHIAAKKN